MTQKVATISPLVTVVLAEPDNSGVSKATVLLASILNNASSVS